MSQEEILKALENNKELTSAQIQELIGISRWAINRALKQLIKSQEIEKLFLEKPTYKKKKTRRATKRRSPLKIKN